MFCQRIVPRSLPCIGNAGYCSANSAVNLRGGSVVSPHIGPNSSIMTSTFKSSTVIMLRVKVGLPEVQSALAFGLTPLSDRLSHLTLS